MVEGSGSQDGVRDGLLSGDWPPLQEEASLPAMGKGKVYHEKLLVSSVPLTSASSLSEPHMEPAIPTLLT